MVGALLFMSAPVMGQDDSYETMIRDQRYKELSEILTQKPLPMRTILEKELIDHLETVQMVQQAMSEYEWSSNQDGEAMGQVTKQMQQAMTLFLLQQPFIAKRILMHLRFLHPTYTPAAYFLETAFGLHAKSYSTRNEVEFLLKRSDTYFYNQDYLNARKDLLSLLYLDDNNPMIHKKLGSTYYMTQDIPNAIKSWQMALSLDPSDTRLRDFILEQQATLDDDSADHDSSGKINGTFNKDTIL